MQALFRDLERQVTVNAATGWGIERVEYEGLLEGALDSVCRVEPLTRMALQTWLIESIGRLGGPVEQAWRERDKRMSAVDELLVMTRISRLLKRAEESAGECPFWIEPESAFRGRQISQQQWQISFGGGGKGIAVQQGDRVDLSAGGAGRLMIGRVFNARHALYAGIELGGSAGFPKDETGERTALVIAIDLVTPLVYRHTLTNAFWEVEAGYLGRATEDDWSDLDPGFHIGVAIGARALRTRFFFPGVALGLSYERTFVAGDDLTTMKVGARVNFDLDL